MSFLSFVKNKMLVVPLEESLVRSGTTSIFYKRNGHVLLGFLFYLLPPLLTSK